MQKLPSVVLTFQEADSRTYVLVIAMKRDESQVGVILDRFNFLEVEITQEMLGVKDEVGRSIEGKVASLMKEQEVLARDANGVVEKNREKLLSIWENLKLNELYYRIQANFSKTARTVILSGWIPATKQQQVQQTLEAATGNHFYSEWRNPENIEKDLHHDVKVPVKLSNAKFFSPFQMLVTNYSIPEYGTIDPTPIVAVLYLLMFGLMFADVGQGLVLMIVGFLGVFTLRKKKTGVYELLKLVIYCGAVSIVGGILFGSYFGFSLIPAVWFNYHSLLVPGHAPTTGSVRSVIDVLIITLYFGIMTIGLGLLLNWINCIRTRKWFRLFFDKGGILGSWIYGGGVFVVYSFAQTGFKSVPDNTAMLFALGIPVCLIGLKSVVEFILHKKHDPTLKFSPATPIKFFGEWLMEIFEIFSGYLSNTLSFMRVAGLGIAHVALMIAFFDIATKLGTGGEFSVVSWIVLVLGNVVVIAFEGLSAGIQSLRLNYYEFFSKYFRGSGEIYAPVSLEDRN
ncbi:MAG: ATPase V [Spirochaetaceae bacterium]|nr:MAG: ATPase V [Spirochaetaceae bacterium]